MSPLLVVIDYSETRTADVEALIRAGHRRPGGPTCLLLTARTIEAEEGRSWLDKIVATLRRDALLLRLYPPIRLDDQHPRGAGVFRRARAAFAARRAADPPAPAAPSVFVGSVLPGEPAARLDLLAPPPGRWTTLDLVMLAWLATRPGARRLPNERGALYDEILGHELDYWDRTAQPLIGASQPNVVWAKLAACLTLLGPVPDRVASVVTAVGGFAAEPQPAQPSRPGLLRRLLGRRAAPGSVLTVGSPAEKFAKVLTDLLPPDPGVGRVTLRPDPVGDHVMVRRLAVDPALLRRCLALATDEECQHAVVALTRASHGGSRDGDATVALARLALDARPNLWSAALAVATAQAGPFLPALEALAQRPDTPLPLAELAKTIPIGHAYLRRLALIATQRSAQSTSRMTGAGPTAGDLAELATRAAHLNDLSNRQGQAGDLAGALNSITEAVTLHRVLTAANSSAFTPNLAMSLNNLSNWQGEVGDWAGALATITEAVSLYRALAAINSSAFTPNLAMSLNNLSNWQGKVGDRAGALASITEAVTLRRGLAGAKPAAFTPDLAMSLNNLSVHQSEVGDRARALASIAETVTLYRTLAATNPAAFTSDLAMSLNNLAGRQSEVGDRAGALAAITEAVGLYRALAAASPAAFTPDLAMSLNNLAGQQTDAGDRAGALTSITEAVALRRALAAANPAAFAPDLAMSLNNLAGRQGEAGDRAGALTSITEAVNHYRVLAQANPAAFTPNLAMSLNNLANCQSDAGDRAGALTSITEAVALLRVLAEASPQVFTPEMSLSLTNLSNRQADTGDRAPVRCPRSRKRLRTTGSSLKPTPPRSPPT